MTDKPKLPPLPPPQTRIVDESGLMTKEFYDFLLRFKAAVEAEIAAARQKSQP